MSKNFLITGAARGIGRGLSRHLLHQGHRVFLLDIDAVELDHMNSNVLPQLSLPLASTEPPYKTYLADLQDPSAITAAAAAASTFFHGRLDVLVNNAFAGPVGLTPFASLPLAEWSRTINTNLTGTMLLTQACLPLLRRSPYESNAEPESTPQPPDSKSKSNPKSHSKSISHGRGLVINISSTRAYQSEPNSEAYATTKAGLLGLTHALAASLAPDNISVNAVVPGWIHVADECKDADERGGTRREDELSEADHEWHWTGRVGRVEDVLAAVEYLVAAAGFVTGQELVVDGGVSRKMVYPE